MKDDEGFCYLVHHIVTHSMAIGDQVIEFGEFKFDRICENSPPGTKRRNKALSASVWKFYEDSNILI